MPDPAASFILRVYALLPKGILYYCLVAFLTAIGALSVALDVVRIMSHMIRS